MRSTVLFTQLALLTSTTLAFYPYAPDWLKEEWAAKRSLGDDEVKGLKLDIKQRTGESTPSPEGVARHAARLAGKYGRRQSEASVDAPVVKRDNTFRVMEAAETKGERTAGIHQDGTDYSYFVQVQLGSKGRDFYMLVDTGAGSSWIMGSDCDTEACAMHDTFGSEDSDTFKDDGKEFSIRYGTGIVNGTLATDTLTLAGMSFDYNIGVAAWTSNDFTQFSFDGILGFSGSKGSNQNLLAALAESGELDKNIFCVALHRAADGPNTGEISFGAINSDRHSGKVSYTSLAKEDDWAIEIDDMSFNGKEAGVGGKLAYIDTGTSFIFGPEDDVEKLHKTIPGAESSDGKTWRVPCDTKGTLAFTFSGVDYEVSPKDWVSPQNNNGKCTSNIYGFEIVAGAWLLGDTFIKNVYAVFDRDDKRIGFAPLVAPEAPETTSSSSSEASPTKTSTSSSSSETEQSSSVTSTSESAPSTEAGPGLGGHETTAQESSATVDREGPAQTNDEQEEEESSASGNLISNAKYAALLCMSSLFALLI